MVHYRWYELVQGVAGMNWVRGLWYELVHTIPCPLLTLWNSQVNDILCQFIISNLFQIDFVGIRCSATKWIETLLTFYQSNLFKNMEELPSCFFGYVGFSGKRLDRRPTNSFIVCTIGEAQKHQPRITLCLTILKDIGHYFYTH